MIVSLSEGGRVCLRLPGSIGDGVNTLNRERGTCVGRIDVENSSVANETPSPLLSGEELLATGLSVGSALRRFC